MIKSNITGKEYDPDNVIYISNMKQNAKYFSCGADQYLVDIVSDINTMDKLCFVYQRCVELEALYVLWNNNTL